MKVNQPTTLLSASLITLLLFSVPVHARIVCWTNSDGIRECGNAVPPEYAQKERQTFNEQGRTVDTQERAKSKEELAAERVRLAEEERKAAEAEALKRAKQNYDRVLLATYLSEDDINRSRNSKLEAINASIGVTQGNIEKLQLKLDEEKKKAAGYERKGKELPERMQQDITSLQEQIEDKNRYITSKEEEKTKLNAKFDAEIERFRELKGDGVKLR